MVVVQAERVGAEGGGLFGDDGEDMLDQQEVGQVGDVGEGGRTSVSTGRKPTSGRIGRLQKWW